MASSSNFTVGVTFTQYVLGLEKKSVEFKPIDESTFDVSSLKEQKINLENPHKTYTPSPTEQNIS